MPVLIPRIRTIGVRLSEEEYSALERFSLETGARSMSDVARAAILGFLKKPIRMGSLAVTLENAARVSHLEQKILQLTQQLDALKANRKPDFPS